MKDASDYAPSLVGAAHALLAEQAPGARLILLVRTGSHLWGCADSTSDDDVCGIYVKQLEDYLTVDNQPEMVKKTIASFEPTGRELDLSLWDVRKLVRLLGKSNPSALEWLLSAASLYEDLGAGMLRELAWEMMQPRTLALHYLGLCKRHGQRTAASDAYLAKRYLHFYRGLLSCNYVINHEDMPPADVRELARACGVEELKRMEGLVEAKLSLREMPRDEQLEHEFSLMVERLHMQASGIAQRKPDTSKLDRVFRQLVLGVVEESND
ncbi:MAG: nucleotidyltransferase domain-containing protein [Atopobiaceae bacterium]|nr:nucleotidyltransferase domain-containing protein [Atopobiaceae bacterium]